MTNNGKFFELLTSAVAIGQTVREAAAQCGCSESHAYRLSRQEDFKTRVNELRTSAVQQAVAALTTATSQAVETLVALLADTQDAPVRLNAAKAILANVGPLADHAELRARIDAIERAHANPG